MESNGRPGNSPPSRSRTGQDVCIRCMGLMVMEYYMDLLDDTGQIGVTLLRCTSCGNVIDPVILQNRLNQPPDLVHAVK